MRKLLPVLVAMVAAAWFAGSAFATVDPGSYIQVCKATTTTALSGPFTFHVAGSDYNLLPGTCTPQILVTPNAAGNVNVVEVAHPWFKVAAVDYRDAMGTLHTVTPPTYDRTASGYTFPIPVTPGGPANTTIVHVTNDPVMGTLEICKYAQSATNASGTFTFTVSSPKMGDDDEAAVGWNDNLPAPANVLVNVGSCSGPIAVPAGETIVTELPTNGYLFVTKIDVTPSTNLVDASADLGKGTVHVTVRATADAVGETMVAYYNSLATLKVCKAAHNDDPIVIALGPYSFTATGAAAPFMLTPTDEGPVCHEVGQLAPGTPVTVTEGTVPGTAVSDISLNSGPFAITDTVNKAARTVTFFMRPGVNEVTFTNDPAASVPLKVCKYGTGLTGTFSFTTSGLTGYTTKFWGLKPALGTMAPTAFTVVPGQCTWLGYFPYDGTITITELSGNLTGVTIDPASTTAVFAPAPVGGTNPNLTARTAAVILGSYTTWNTPDSLLFPAIVNFTNAPAATGGSGSDSGSGSGSGATTTVAPTASTASASAPTKVVAPAKAMKVASARVVTIGHNRYVVVRVNGAAKTARIHVTLIDKNHKVVGKLTRYVATNKAVRVGNLRLAPSVFSVKVSL